MAGFLFGAFLKRRRISLLDNRPLEGLLAKYLDFSRIEGNIAKGALDAVAISCSGYTSGQSCSFFQGADHSRDGSARSASASRPTSPCST
jgi:NTE family protein